MVWLQVHREGEAVRLFSRRGFDWTAHYPAIVRTALALPAKSFTLDGEAVICSGDGIAVFEDLHRRRIDAREVTKRIKVSSSCENGWNTGASLWSRSRHRVFNSLDRAGSDNLPSRLRLESRGLLGEWIDALARLRGRLLYDDEFGEPRHNERAGLLKFLMADCGHRFDDLF